MHLTVNFASQKRHRERFFKRLLSLVILLLGGVLVLQIVQFSAHYRLEGQYRRHLAELERQLQGDSLKPVDGDRLAALKSDYDQARKLLNRDAFRWTRLFDQIESVLPDGISLRGFNPDYDKNVLILNGISRDLGSLQSLLDNLHAEDFRDAFLLQQSEVGLNDNRGRKKTALSFSIHLTGVF